MTANSSPDAPTMSSRAIKNISRIQFSIFAVQVRLVDYKMLFLLDLEAAAF